MTIFVLNGLTALMVVAMALFSGCNVAHTAPGAQAVPAEKPVMFVGIADEDVVVDSERVARDSAELERIRIEGMAAQGPVRNDPDYNR